MGYQPLPHTIVDIDIVGSGKLANDTLLLGAREDIRRLLAGVLAQQGIDFNALPKHDLGDGMRLTVPGIVSPAALVDPFVRNLDTALRQHRQRMSDAARLRLRMAIHHGLIHQDGVAAGESLRVVARLLDAAPVRQAARIAAEANLVLVVSQVMYDAVVRHGYGLDPQLFQQIAIAEKETRDTAWLYVPGVTPHLVLDAAAAASEVPSEGSGAPADPPPAGTTSAAVISGGSVVISGGVAGRDINYG